MPGLRQRPGRLIPRILDRVSTIVGTTLPLLLRPTGAEGALLGQLMQLAGAVLYLSYTLCHAGYVWSRPTAANVAVALAALAAQLVRIEREERLLARDPGYAAYRRRTRYRLVPGLY